MRLSNRVERRVVSSGGLSTDSFVFHLRLGKGSFGEVFLVHRKGDETKKLYAMKVLSKDQVMNKNLRRYALTERNVMSVINHPFMVKLNYAFQSSTKLFLVMDYYPGGDLGKLITKRKAIPEEEARKYIC
jgi:serine/threonine protein kinase